MIQLVRRELATVMGLMARFRGEDEQVGELWGKPGAYKTRHQLG